MKTTTHSLKHALLLLVVLLVSCGGKDDRLTIAEEQRIAYEYLTRGCETSPSNEAKRMELFDKATYHFAKLVVRNDADDALRADALYVLRWIEAYQKHGYEAALQYLNQYFELVGSDHADYPAYLAYKADDLWHFGAQDSAMHYAYKALATPHKEHHNVEYICHHVLWQIYEEREMPDSANRHRQLHLATHEDRAFEPLTMEELKNKMKRHIIAPEAEARASHRFPWVAVLILLCATLLLALIALYLYHIRRHAAKPEAAQQQPIAEEKSEPAAQSPTETLSQHLTEGRNAFEHTTAYTALNALRIKEKELPEMEYAQSREIEAALFDAFKTACGILLDTTDLNDQELVTILCTSLGYSNNIIANLGHTTPNTIRKRKERLKKKLTPECYEMLFGSLT